MNGPEKGDGGFITSCRNGSKWLQFWKKFSFKARAVCVLVVFAGILAMGAFGGMTA